MNETGLEVIHFVRLTSEARRPNKTHMTDAGYDLYASEEAIIYPNEFKDVHTGIAIQMPQYLWGEVVGRSSTWRKHKLMVVQGVIDPDYRGEIFSAVVNLGDKPFKVEKGMRLAQLIFHNRIHAAFAEKVMLESTARGANGFGSTGT